MRSRKQKVGVIGTRTRVSRFDSGRPTPPTYRSKFEARLATLPALKDADYEGWKFQYPQPLATYCLDFRLPNGICIEAKGFFSPSDRMKMRAVQAAHPYLDLRMVLQTPYKTLSKDSMTTYAAWCEKYGFPWCAGNDTDTLTAWAEERGIYG